jgi:uroporphyrinogen-III synthase
VLTALDDEIRIRIARAEIRLITNGPRISAVVREFGFEVASESAEPTVESLIEALVDLWRRRADSI